MAPEIQRNERYSTPADIYSLGCIILESVLGDSRYLERHHDPARATRGGRPPIPDSVMPDVAKLIELAWHEDPDKRPSAAVISNILDTSEVINRARNSRRESTLNGSGAEGTLASWASKSGKTFAAFLSHHKAACAMEARYIKTLLEDMTGGSAKMFLDSDDLKDLNKLLEQVEDTAVS